MIYLGKHFRNYEELENWNRNGHIAEYRKLAEMFSRNPSMELSCMMSDRAEVLVKEFGLTWEQVEQLEIA